MITPCNDDFDLVANGESQQWTRNLAVVPPGVNPHARIELPGKDRSRKRVTASPIGKDLRLKRVLVKDVVAAVRT